MYKWDYNKLQDSLSSSSCDDPFCLVLDFFDCFEGERGDWVVFPWGGGGCCNWASLYKRSSSLWIARARSRLN
jgi:hypothetical protein